jgi:hypothetical protein
MKREGAAGWPTAGNKDSVVSLARRSHETISAYLGQHLVTLRAVCLVYQRRPQASRIPNPRPDYFSFLVGALKPPALVTKDNHLGESKGFLVMGEVSFDVGEFVHGDRNDRGRTSRRG